MGQRGRIFVTTTRLDGALHLRAAVGSFRTHLEDVEAAVEELVAQTDRVTRARSATIRPARVETSLPGLTRITRVVRSRGAGMLDKLEVIVDVDGAELEETRQCELEVLGCRYGDTAEDLEAAYGAYEDDSVFVALRHSRHGVVGFTRLIAPGPLTQKTLTDIGEQPWSVNGAEVARATGLDPHRTWDVATVGAWTDLPLANGTAAGILYSAVLSVPLANGGQSLVAIIDRRVRDC